MSVDWMQKLGAATPLGNGRLLVPYEKGPAPDDIKMDFVREHAPLEVRVPVSGEEGDYDDYKTFELTPDMSRAEREEVAKAVWKRPRAAEVSKLTKVAKRTFTDEGTTYDVEKLWQVRKKAKKVNPNRLLKNTGRTWGDRPNRYGWKDVLADPDRYKNEIRRIHGADLKYPILLHKGVVVDGIHRLVKAKQTGQKVKAITLSKRDMELAKVAGYSLRKAMLKELKEIAEAAKEVRDKPMSKEHWKGYTRHSAMNAGQAARALRYFTDYPKAKSKGESMKKRTAQLVNSLAFTVLPPTHHTPESMKGMARGVGSHRDWFKRGYAPWKYPDPEKVAKKRITKEDIHQKAESLGIIWDYDKPGSEPFLRHSVRVTGKTHVDDMTPSEVEALYDSLEAMEKKAEEGGHWRRLKPGQKGHDQFGNKAFGKTWVSKSRMKPSMKAMPHQADFTKAVKQQLGKKRGGGIIAAHGTGTGKTFSAINAFEELKGTGRARRALVLTPAGLRDNFLTKGINKFTDSKGVILRKPKAVSADTEYVVVSYDAFRLDPDAWIDKVQPDTIIADEVHRAANPAGKTYKALRKARERVPRFMGLTASVVQNKPEELVPLLDLATKGETPFKSTRQFKKTHVAQRKSEQRGIFGGTTYEKKLIRTALLKSSVGEAVHYIEDLDASKKPAKFVTTVNVPMSTSQLKLYRDAMKGLDPVVRKKIAEGQEVSKSEAKNVFLRLMRARQVSNSLHLGTPHMTPRQSAEKTPKIKKILDDATKHIRSTPDAQIVMYTNLVHGGVDVLQAGLKKRGISYGIFAGRGVEGVTEETRQKAVEDYLAGKNKVIIITGAGAEGLSLGNTTMVQLVDGHYNPERISQAEARGIRAGGLSHRPVEERKVQVRRYVSAIPKTFWQTITFKPAERSAGQWVYRTATKKERLNRQLRDVLKKRSEHERRQRESIFYRFTHPDRRLS